MTAPAHANTLSRGPNSSDNTSHFTPPVRNVYHTFSIFEGPSEIFGPGIFVIREITVEKSRIPRPRTSFQSQIVIPDSHDIRHFTVEAAHCLNRHLPLAFSITVRNIALLKHESDAVTLGRNPFRLRIENVRMGFRIILRIRHKNNSDRLLYRARHFRHRQTQKQNFDCRFHDNILLNISESGSNLSKIKCTREPK